MSMTLMMASILPLVSINAGDARLSQENVFVSKKAEQVLAGERKGDVLCLERTNHKHICLARAEWSKAVTMAHAYAQLRHHTAAIPRDFY